MPERQVRSVAVISVNAHSLVNFRGPLIQAMVEAGAKVWALAPDLDDTTREAVKRLGAEPVDIPIDRTGMHPLRDLLDMAKLALVLRKLRPDASFGYFIKPVIYGSIAARLAGVPRRIALVAGMGYVFTPDGGRESFGRRILRLLVTRLYKIGLASADRVLFHNPDDLAMLAEMGLVGRGKTTLVSGTGVDLDYYRPAPPVQQPVRFLLIGRMLREKGIVEFAEAARVIKSRHPQVEFHLVGGADSNPGALGVDRIAGWAADGYLEWHGQVEDVRPWISRSSVFVLPSYREGKPRSTQEAMAMAKPVVTTDAPGCRDTVTHGVNGYIVRTRDAAALIEAMLHFVQEPSRIATMGAESRRLAEQWFDVRKINATILDVIGIRPVARTETNPG